ncbi:MAG: tRNA lysidine(34) synthetase TilS [Chloroflexi bacterium]|nr:tRNA lysidine(34) synthetase TilS [Chloroflexota bacterium]
MRAGDRLLAAVSGGPDSVALLLALANLRPRLGIDLHVVHFNHLLRGAESDADEQFVLELAGHLGLPASVGRADVRRLSHDTRTSIEAAARRARYAFFCEAAARIGAAAVATGHQADDQVETVLLHLLRGTGTAGLRGMLPRTVLRLDGGELTVVRPLLAVTRAEVEQFCRARGVTPRADPTNDSTEFVRNRIRLELLPALERFNPQIRPAIRRLAHLAADDVAVVDAAVAAAWPTIARVEPACIQLAKPALLALPAGLQRHVVRRAVRQLLGDLLDLSAVHLEAVEAALSRPAGTRLDLPRGLVFAVGYEEYTLTLGPPEPGLPPLPGSYPLVVPGETALPGWTVRATVVPYAAWVGRGAGGTPALPGAAGAEGEPAGAGGTPALPEAAAGEAYSACFDLAKTGAALVVRTRRPGDRFQPLGLAGTKKLQDFFVDAKVSRAWRDRVPLVCAGEEIVWVVGWRVDGRFAVGPETEEVLCLDFTGDGRDVGTDRNP